MDTAKVVRIHRTGGPEVLQVEDLPRPEPKEGQVRIKVQAIGLNRADVLFRTGAYLEQPQFPSLIGVEASGIVDALGPGVSGIKLGDKISVATGQSMGEYGTYAESVLVHADCAIPYPSNLTPEEAASVWVQYLTAWFAPIVRGPRARSRNVCQSQAGKRELPLQNYPRRPVRAANH